MKTVNELSLDEHAIANAIRQYLYGVSDDVMKKLKEAFAREVMFAGAGKTRWREEAGNAFDQIERITTEDYIETIFGISDEHRKDGYQNARIMVALWGNQEHGPIQTKPGKWVYGDTMDNDQHISTALTERAIPQFDQLAYGGKMLDNCIKICQKYLKDALEAGWKQLPNSVFYGNLHVKGG